MAAFVTSFQTAEQLSEALRTVDGAYGKSAIALGWTAFDRANYQSPSSYSLVSSSMISVRYSNGDSATIYGKGLTSTTRSISRLDYKFQDGTEVSLQGAVTSTTGKSPTGTISQVTLTKTGKGTTTFYGSSDISGQNISLSKQVTDLNGVHYEENGTTTGYLLNSGSNYRLWYETTTSSISVSTAGQSATISGLSFQTSAQIPSMAPEALLSTLLSGSDTLASSGSAGAALFGYGGNDTLSGGAGIDTAIYHGSRANYVITKTATGYQITDTRGTEGADTLKNVERLKFYDSKVALDLEPAYGRAAQTAKILGAVFGAESLTNKSYVGTGLSLLDSGMSYPDLMKFALEARLGKGYSNADEIELLYTNLVGAAPSAEELGYWVKTITSGQFTQTTLAIMAADLDLNQTNIGLTGLANTGLEYV